jgi:hypothetical protein
VLPYAVRYARLAEVSGYTAGQTSQLTSATAAELRPLCEHRTGRDLTSNFVSKFFIIVSEWAEQVSATTTKTVVPPCTDPWNSMSFRILVGYRISASCFVSMPSMYKLAYLNDNCDPRSAKIMRATLGLPLEF